MTCGTDGFSAFSPCAPMSSGSSAISSSILPKLHRGPLNRQFSYPLSYPCIFGVPQYLAIWVIITCSLRSPFDQYVSNRIGNAGSAGIVRGGFCYEENASTCRDLFCASGFSGAWDKRGIGSTTDRGIRVPRACRTRVPVYGAYGCFTNEFRTTFRRTKRTSWNHPR